MNAGDFRVRKVLVEGPRGGTEVQWHLEQAEADGWGEGGLEWVWCNTYWRKADALAAKARCEANP